MATTVASTEDLWDKTRAAQYLGVSEGTLKEWRYRGKGPLFVRVGKHVRYDPVDVRRWCEGLKGAARVSAEHRQEAS